MKTSPRISQIGGINVFDLIGSPITKQDWIDFVRDIELQKDKTYPVAKWNALAKMILEDQWTNERLQYVKNQFLKYHGFPSWNINDFFKREYDVRVYNELWYQSQKSKGKEPEIETFVYNGKKYYKFDDGVNIPLQRYIENQSKNIPDEPPARWKRGFLMSIYKSNAKPDLPN